MKKQYFYLLTLIISLSVIVAFKSVDKAGNRIVATDIKSISALTFAPDGTLFVGDSKLATVFALKLKDPKAQKKVAPIAVKNIDQKIAAALGTEVANITITDMAINPVSQNLYISVQHSDGTPVLLKLVDGKLTAVSLSEVTGTSVLLNNAPAEDAKDQRGRSLRVSTISDLGFDDGKLLVSGLSNHEFSSSFKSIPYPFTSKQDEATLEIYHAAHGRYETAAPIKTFTTAMIDNKKYLVASYTCTPLVLFAMDDLQPGKHVKGRTVAEMGSGNTPIDMITFQKGSESFLLMANTKHPVARVDYKNIATFAGTLTEPVKGTAGVNFTATPSLNVMQMDKLDNNQVVMMQKQINGDVDLLTTDGSTI
jgi:hypothetical protein